MRRRYQTFYIFFVIIARYLEIFTIFAYAILSYWLYVAWRIARCVLLESEVYRVLMVEKQDITIYKHF